jgi:hypothetical protein
VRAEINPRAQLAAALTRLATVDLKRWLIFLVVFVGVKAGALLGVLWLARVADPAVYAAVELGIGVGLIVAGVASLGVPGAVTRLALVGGEERVSDYLSFTSASIALPASVIALGAGLAFGWNASITLVVACCALTAVQTIGTTYARIRARPLLNSMLDPLATLVILAVALGLWVIGSLNQTALSVALTVIAWLLASASVIAFVRVKRDKFGEAIRRVLVLGLPILALSGVAMIVGAGLRPLLAIRFDLEALALYALCFRLCAPALLVHQVLNTGVFARLYRASDRSFDLVLLGSMIVNCTVVLVLWLLIPSMIASLFPQYAGNLMMTRGLFAAVGAQVVLWLAVSLLEMKMGRHELAGQAAAAGYAIFAAYVVAIYASALDTLRDAVVFFAASLLALALAKCAIAWKAGVRLPLTAVGAVCAFCVFSSLALMG